MARAPRPGLPSAEDSADLDASERAYQEHKANLRDMWRGRADAAQDDDDYDDNATTGIQRADAPDDIQQMSLREQDVYVSAYNAFVEQNPDGTAEEADEAARAALEPRDSADAAANLEAVRAAYHADYVRRISNAWKT